MQFMDNKIKLQNKDINELCRMALDQAYQTYETPNQEFAINSPSRGASSSHDTLTLEQIARTSHNKASVLVQMNKAIMSPTQPNTNNIENNKIEELSEWSSHELHFQEEI